MYHSNTISYAILMLFQRLQRWPNIKTTLTSGVCYGTSWVSYCWPAINPRSADVSYLLCGVWSVCAGHSSGIRFSLCLAEAGSES